MMPQRHPLPAMPPAVTTPSLFLEAGACVYRAGEAATGLFRIRSGRVRLSVAHDGRERLVALLGPGDLFGDAGWTGGRSPTRTETARCDIPTRLGLLGDDVDADRGAPAHAGELVEALLADRRVRARRLRLMCFENVENRLSGLLADLSARIGDPCRHGSAGRDLSCVTQEDLADLVGSSRAFVSTTLNRLKRDGTLATIGRVLCLHGLAPGGDGTWTGGHANS